MVTRLRPCQEKSGRIFSLPFCDLKCSKDEVVRDEYNLAAFSTGVFSLESVG